MKKVNLFASLTGAADAALIFTLRKKPSLNTPQSKFRKLFLDFGPAKFEMRVLFSRRVKHDGFDVL